MNNYFESVLLNATLICDGMYIDEYEDRNVFSQIYPFTTESINGYISKFDLDNKSLLIVGSSGDQVINASLFNCKDQTIIDICPFTKFYFYLKKSCLLGLNYHSFLSFLCYVDFPKVFKYNDDVFNVKIFNKIKPILRLLDYESYLFWDELFSLFSPTDIRKQLFKFDEYRVDILSKLNLYLRSEDYYEIARKNIKTFNPKFINGDVFDVILSRKYDNIFFSNLLQYYSRDDIAILIEKFLPNLNDGGKMLVAYLYRTTYDTKYHDDWAPIYDLDRTMKLLEAYNISLESFRGVYDYHDSVLIYKK